MIRAPWMRLLVVLAAATLAIFAIACGDDDDDPDGGDLTPSATEPAGEATEPADASEDEAAIRDLLDEFVAAWNAKDFEAVKGLHTEKGLIAQIGGGGDLSTEEARRAAFDEQTADFTIVVDSVDDVSAEGESGTAAVTAYQQSRENPVTSAILAAVQVATVKQGDAWLIDDVTFPPIDAPESGTAIPVDANEFAFAITEEPADGDIYFAVANKGQQPHQVVIIKLPSADFDVEAALQSDEDPEGTLDIGGTPPWDPGTTQNVVFSEPLESGYYVMLCFIPDSDDPEETPHAFKGMWTKFEIP